MWKISAAMLYCEWCREAHGWAKGLSTSLATCESCFQEAQCHDVEWIAQIFPKCSVEQCERPAIKNRKLCEYHAFPAERPKSNRRAAVEATRRKAQVPEEDADK